MEPAPIPELSLEPRPAAGRGLLAELAVTMGLGALAVVLLNTTLFWLLGQQLELERREELTRASATALAAQLELEGSVDRQAAMLQAFNQQGLQLQELWLYRPQGTDIVVLGMPPGAPDEGLKQALNMGREHVRAARGESVTVTVPVGMASGQGALRVQVRNDGHGLVSPGLGLVLSFSVGTGLALALGGFVVVRRRLLAPVQALTRATERIAGGDFGHTTQLRAVRELGDMAGALNVMSVSLAAYRSRTREQVADLEQANAELKSAQEELIRAARLASVGGLAAGIAHEVGNPLAAVVGYTELLLDGVGDAQVERDLLLRTQKELGRIHAIIRQLLDYARPTPGRRVERSAVECIQDALATVQPLPRFAGVSLRSRVEPSLPGLVEEEGRLHQVLLNLLLNARDAMGGEGTVVLYAKAHPLGLEFGCQDSGPGFPGEVIGRVFEPFVSTKEAGKGTGLGLATCQRIVEMAGGEIQARNLPQGGAEVSFTWPGA
ncbi:MAG: ATP-binding protein [Myxococcota bacterium]|nr:ATP-binding protein [Myxococcota bacterium]